MHWNRGFLRWMGRSMRCQRSVLTARETMRRRWMPSRLRSAGCWAGFRWRSRTCPDFIPEESCHLVQRIEDEGGVVYAKTNTPEFGAGANTFNEVFGATRNPWNTALSAAGSSGGSAVALATGTAWLANGSDMGGSLRNPASFCGIVGMRPSPGRVPGGPSADPYSILCRARRSLLPMPPRVGRNHCGWRSVLISALLPLIRRSLRFAKRPRANSRRWG